MTPPPPPVAASGGRDEGCRSAAAVAGLARELDAMRRTLDAVSGLPDTVEDLGRLVAELAGKVSAMSARAVRVPAPSWLMAPDDPDLIERVLDDLCAWLHAVYLRYPDGAVGLPECWLYHPDVVEELVWLMHSWCAAYQGPAASVGLAAEWHERHRPGVVRRIHTQVKACGWDLHRTRLDRDQIPTGATDVPGRHDTAVIAGWWAAGRDAPAPEPPAERAPLLTGRRRR